MHPSLTTAPLLQGAALGERRPLHTAHSTPTSHLHTRPWACSTPPAALPGSCCAFWAPSSAAPPTRSPPPSWATLLRRRAGAALLSACWAVFRPASPIALPWRNRSLRLCGALLRSAPPGWFWALRFVRPTSCLSRPFAACRAQPSSGPPLSRPAGPCSGPRLCLSPFKRIDAGSRRAAGCRWTPSGRRFAGSCLGL